MTVGGAERVSLHTTSGKSAACSVCLWCHRRAEQEDAWGSCCIAEQPQPKRRRRIDRSMIGEPTNFVHTTHVGSGEMSMAFSSVDCVQAQMKSKGGYGHGASDTGQG
ncbi:hypothetical protein AAFF_G00428430 [Aldrovandia affinis]|uniref:CRIB domain-containing protein n=1 Tax=Aldrovandia affinis TaxID=143900 RepID=A0AAD7S9E3_9TELE|nr:hypothetical protein AAFF_G00428430 [Aldrovandia affinis]